MWRMTYDTLQVELQKNQGLNPDGDWILSETGVKLTASPHYQAFHPSQRQHQQLAEVLALWILQP
jgi:hypothetical protein